MKTKKNHRLSFPIDVVYTWVGEEKFSNNIRLSYNNELKYSLRSIDYYAPWVNKIYILMNTSNQPSWIKPNDKIIIVDHTDTFPSKEYLPNTNSNAIETTICNIPNLSEHYIYFNDDVFLGKKVKYTHFFTPDGKAKIHNFAVNTVKTIKNNYSKQLNVHFPPNTNEIYKHVPIVYIKSLVLQFNHKYADDIHWIRTTKIRKGKGFNFCKENNLNTPCQQIHYAIAKYMYLKNKAVLTNLTKNIEYINGLDYMILLPKVLIKKPIIFCINDTEKEEEKRKLFTTYILQFFNAYFPTPARFEL